MNENERNSLISNLELFKGLNYQKFNKNLDFIDGDLKEVAQELKTKVQENMMR